MGGAGATYVDIPPVDEEELGGLASQPEDDDDQAFQNSRPKNGGRTSAVDDDLDEFHVRVPRNRVRKSEGFQLVRNIMLFGVVVLLLTAGLAVFLLEKGSLLSFSKHLHGNGTNVEGGVNAHNDDDNDDDSYSAPFQSQKKREYNPFKIQMDPSWYGSFAVPPPYPRESDGNDETDKVPVGYFQQPSIHNNTLLFVSEGDLYLAQIQSDSKEASAVPVAMKLTTTVGNVISPVINPKFPYLIAYTATYTGHREVYLMDLRPARRGPAMRLTFTPTSYGVNSVVGWTHDGTRILYAAESMHVGLPDTRVYEIQLNETKDEDFPTASRKSGKLSVFTIEDIPLSQSTDAVVDESSKCIYFVRYKQSSNTVRYVGGTAESLWAYCPEKSTAVALTANYKGTSRSPRIYTHNDKKYLLFLSDRSSKSHSGEDIWVPTSMELWAMPLPSETKLYDHGKMMSSIVDFAFIQLTHVACMSEYNGMAVQEYAIDQVTNNIVLRIGASFHLLRSEVIGSVLKNGSGSNRRFLEDEPADLEDFGKDAKAEEDVSVSQQSAAEKKPPKTSSSKIEALSIAVFSDFHQHQERIRIVNMEHDLKDIDFYDTAYGETSALMSVRGQVFVAPVLNDVTSPSYEGSSSGIPPRRYRLAPGSTTGGVVRVLAAKHVPLPLETGVRKALFLATDPLSPTAEHAFYLVESQASSISDFADINQIHAPILGGHVNGGSTRNGGLGSVLADSLTVSPCGRRVAWADTDGRICALTLPYPNVGDTPVTYTVLPPVNENGEPMVGDGAVLTWSPGGRYLAIEHQARNQMSVISIGDLGDPSTGNIEVFGRIVQATPDRFNSGDAVWGRIPLDSKMDQKGLAEGVELNGGSSTLYFMSDGDVRSDVSSPWGTRAPSPHFPRKMSVYGLPLVTDEDYAKRISKKATYKGVNPVMELLSDEIVAEENTPPAPTASPTFEPPDQENYPKDMEISFGPVADHSLSFARRAYRIASVPAAHYVNLVCQCGDDLSLVIVEKVGSDDEQNVLKVFGLDKSEPITIEVPGGKLQSVGLNTGRDMMYVMYSGIIKVMGSTSSEIAGIVSDSKFENNIADADDMSLSIWPSLEYQQMYSDAWRMLRDYFYDPDMTGINWPEMHARYLPLVEQCAKREELDDVLKQMAAELSALHVFVHSGEYADPSHGSGAWKHANKLSSLGASLKRSVEWNGYIVESIYERDPDFNVVDGSAVYSPLSDHTLGLSGQKGLKAGDVILRVNGESVMSVPDIHLLLRGLAGSSVRLDVIRVSSSGDKTADAADVESTDFVPEPVMTVPITTSAASDLRYAAWEWKTRQEAKSLAAQANFSVGYIHLPDMSETAIDAFARGYFPDYDKDALIVDVRHNRGGNIDAWLLDILQKHAWTYWQGRATNITTGGLGWDEHFAFRGRIVVLINEGTSSDGEGFSRGFSELKLGTLIGTRTWGGGIWLSSDNRLVDGGIATAPEVGTYSDKFGWGMGIEQMGVDPDIVVDNDPHEVYEGKDEQLERAIGVLQERIQKDPVRLPKRPGPKKDMSLKQDLLSCPSE